MLVKVQVLNVIRDFPVLNLYYYIKSNYWTNSLQKLKMLSFSLI